MARQTVHPELYELVTDYILRHPNKVIGSEDLRIAFADENAASLEVMFSILGRLHDTTLRRVVGLHSEFNSIGAQCWAKLSGKGLFYRTTVGHYVLDPNARIARNRITHNAYPVHIGAALNSSPSKKALTHPYKNTKTIPVWVKKTERTEDETVAEPAVVAAPASEAVVTPLPSVAQWLAAEEKTEPTIVVLARDPENIVIQVNDEVLICKIAQVVPR